VGDRIIAAISLGISRISKEYARKRAGGELMRGGSGSAGLAAASKDAKVSV
jgi:hypothetical protein